jgi:hypothetical protein
MTSTIVGTGQQGEWRASELQKKREGLKRKAEEQDMDAGLR